MDMSRLASALEAATGEDDEGADPTFDPSDLPANVRAALAENREGLQELLQGRLDGLVGKASGFVEALPVCVQRRVHAMRGLQEKRDELEEAFHEERRALEAKYRGLYAPLYARRSMLVRGESEPTEEELGDDVPQTRTADAGDVEALGDETTHGVPEFWLTALSNHEDVAQTITEKDQAVLEHLVDVRLAAPSKDNEYGFALEFEFSPNPFFTNGVLRKEYYMDDDDPEAPMMERSEGTEIAWHPGKDVTCKVLKKKNKKTGKMMTKKEPVDSFFQFFSPPETPDEDASLEEEELEALQEAVEADYDQGCVFKNDIIPNAVLWFTGEAIEDEGDDSDEDDDEEDMEGNSDEDDDSDGDDDSDQGGRPRHAKGARNAAPGEKPECKQQ